MSGRLNTIPPRRQRGRKRAIARLATVYGVFGLISTGCNLLTQSVIHEAWPPAPGTPDMAYWFALVMGTGVGLVVKFVLDKMYIFEDHSTSGAKEHGVQFSLYAFLGIFTTIIFWGSQTAFFVIWKTENMLMVGGALGLAVGYVVKYHLDQRFVFKDRTA